MLGSGGGDGGEAEDLEGRVEGKKYLAQGQVTNI